MAKILRDYSGRIYKGWKNYAGQQAPINSPVSGTMNALTQSALSVLRKLNPNGDKLTFALFSDFHNSDGHKYGGVTYDGLYNLGQLRLLGQEYKFDVILNAGDVCSGRNEENSDRDHVAEDMDRIYGLFNDYFPDTLVYNTIGNHDKQYSASRDLQSNESIRARYDTIHGYSSGIELGYCSNSSDETNYYVDFLNYKIRLIVVNLYDDVDLTLYPVALRTSTIYRNGFNLDKGSDTSNWLIAMMHHGDTHWTQTNKYPRVYFEAFRNGVDFKNNPYTDWNPATDWHNENKDQSGNIVPGKGYIIQVGGHTHSSDHGSQTGMFTGYSRVEKAHGNVGASFISFSVFVVDSDCIYEVRVCNGIAAPAVFKYPIIDSNEKAANADGAYNFVEYTYEEILAQ